MTEPAQEAAHFLSIAAAFKLGALPSEGRHPLTHDLANLSRNDIPRALGILKTIDVGVIDHAIQEEARLAPLRSAVSQTLRDGNRIFLYGCGATGRLSMSNEYLWRYTNQNDPGADRVTGFMSGGDLALVHSIENFEDRPAWGARQVREIGFGQNDLLISCTEGGETPSVIGATEEAAHISARKPFFLYCNPDEPLRTVERSQDVLDNPQIEKICLDVGPMALSGSTRMQASTILMLASGAALMDVDTKAIAGLRDFLDKTDLGFMADFTRREADLYQQGHYVLYETDIYGVTILTDTTERAPTFSLSGFENQNDPNRKPSLSYMRIPETASALDAWRAILLRDPNAIEWDELRSIAGRDRMLGFDFSRAALGQRQQLTAPNNLHRFIIKRDGNKMTFELDELRREIDVSGLHPLLEHLFLKVALNSHSTLIMGRLGRYESNVMTWVKPSNNKLIDRAIRYVQHLLNEQNITGHSYEDICHALFEERAKMKSTDPIVLKVVDRLKARPA